MWEDIPEAAILLQNNRRNDKFLPGAALATNVTVTSDLQSALRGSQAVVFAIPSEGAAQAAEKAAPYIPSDAIIINAAKGLEPNTGRRLSQVLASAVALASGQAEDTVLQRLAALSGPNLAVEVAQGIPSASVAASISHETACMCQELFMGPTFRVYTSSDIVGVELAGAMKNVVAIGCGICEGCGYGDNTRAALMTRGLAEITRLGAALGAQPATFLGLAGVGDLIATGGSKLSRNYRVGVGLGQGRSLPDILEEIGQVAEGVPTTKAICLLSQQTGIEMPIAQTLYSTLFEGLSIKEAITHLMLRPPREE